ncbi:MAG: hypothetical protein SH818_03915 [Saprospiraceae bacterium]|nr:hypothetical protein [Saprospiraceae bacterium]
MIAICDSGGTKGDWAFFGGSDKQLFASPGFNPYTHDLPMYLEALKSLFESHLDVNSVTDVYFYSAGCREIQQQQKVSHGLSSLFTHSRIEVNQDLLAAARATCGRHSGIACILGTGANSGLYDGYQFTDNIPTLGYLVGDEGGGAHFGKLLIKSYFYREMPDSILKAFDETFPGKHEKILAQLYSKNAPNTYLASFMKFAIQYLEDPFIYKLLLKNFQDFIDTQLSKYQGYQELPVHFVGSVAHYFHLPLKDCLNQNGIQSGYMISKPLDRLIEFHQQQA